MGKPAVVLLAISKSVCCYGNYCQETVRRGNGRKGRGNWKDIIKAIQLLQNKRHSLSDGFEPFGPK